MRPYPNLLHQITSIHLQFHKSKLKLEDCTHASSDLNKFQEFLQLETVETVLLSSIIHLSFRNRETNLTELAEHYGLDSYQFMPYLETISKLAERSLIEYDDINLYRKLLNVEVSPHPRIMEALLKDQPNLIRSLQVTSVGSFFREYDRILSIRKKRTITHEQFIAETNGLCNKGKHITFVKYLGKRKLPYVERNVLLSICLNTLLGYESVNITDVLRDILDDVEDFYKWSTYFKAKGALIFRELLVVPSSQQFATPSEVSLAGNLINQLYPQVVAGNNEMVASELCNVIDPLRHGVIELHYPDNITSRLSVVSSSFKTRKYKALQNKLRANQLKSGITVLLYGPPGTGKTETVYQIARENKRIIMMADMSRIKNMWVGESEKNIKKIFDEYRQACKSLDRLPILLFNEADAVFGTRRRAISGVDSMDNSMQNILLQELEDFEGIFFATTNLAGNLDKAFDRRFLFKIELTIPTSLQRKKILFDKFKEVNRDWLNILAEKYELSGGQIENIRRKMIIEEIASHQCWTEFEQLEKLFRQESNPSMTNPIPKRIGFVQSNRDQPLIKKKPK